MSYTVGYVCVVFPCIEGKINIHPDFDSARHYTLCWSLTLENGSWFRDWDLIVIALYHHSVADTVGSFETSASGATAPILNRESLTNVDSSLGAVSSQTGCWYNCIWHIAFHHRLQYMSHCLFFLLALLSIHLFYVWCGWKMPEKGIDWNKINGFAVGVRSYKPPVALTVVRSCKTRHFSCVWWCNRCSPTLTREGLCGALFPPSSSSASPKSVHVLSVSEPSSF